MEDLLELADEEERGTQPHVALFEGVRSTSDTRMDLGGIQPGSGSFGDPTSTRLDDEKENEIGLLIAEEEEELRKLVESHSVNQDAQLSWRWHAPSTLQVAGHSPYRESLSAYGSDDDEFDDIFRDMEEVQGIPESAYSPEDAMDTSGL